MKKILIIDNDVETMSLLKLLLQKKGYLVKFTGSSTAVQYLIEDFAPHLVIVDFLHRGIAKQLQECQIKAGFKILLITGYNLVSSLNNLAVDGIVEKPFNTVVLLRKVRLLTTDNKSVPDKFND